MTLPGFRSRWTTPASWAASQRLGNLHAEFGRLPRRKLAAGEPFLQAAAVDEVADDVQYSVFAAHLVYAHHAGMLDLCRRPRLANEHLGLRPLDLAAVWDLDRHGAIEFGVAGLPDRAEMPAADAFQKLEMPDRLYGPRSVGGRFAAADQAEIAAARWASDVSQGIGINYLDWIMAVGTADVHG